jgi:putative Flp pilus-assembly TadE/G-like protein
MKRQRERGQSLVLFVVLLPGLLAFCALGLDAGNLYLEKREMQAAADLAALSAAKMLPDITSATSRATSIASANGYSSGVTVTTPYGGNSTKIEVRISRAVDTFFLPVLGVNSLDVSVRSVATANTTAGTDPYALFAGQNSCSGNPSETIKWSGSNSTITGRIHSNAGIKISSGGNTWTGGTTYKCNAAFVDSGTGNVYSPAVTRVPTDTTMPVSYTWANFCTSPTYYHATGNWDLSANGTWWLGGTKASKTLLPGVYCADGTSAEIVLATSDVDAVGVTLVSKGVIRFSAGNFFITPYMLSTSMAAFGSGSDAIKSSAKTMASGNLYAPNGEISFTGPSSGVFSGSMIGRTLTISGSNFTIVGSAGASTTTTYQLSE